MLEWSTSRIVDCSSFLSPEKNSELEGELQQDIKIQVSADKGRFEVEIGDSKNMGGLRIMPRYGIKNKKKSILDTEVSL